MSGTSTVPLSRRGRKPTQGSGGTVVPAPDGEHSPRGREGSGGARPRTRAGDLSGLLGELFVTAGILVLLFFAWQLGWTNLLSGADSARAVAELRADFSSPDDRFASDRVEAGEAFAIVRIPRFGSDFAKPLYEGTSQDVLRRGIGHYESTELPGEKGNLGLAGHRNAQGEPFNRIAELKPGDVVIVETRDTAFVYRVTSHEIVPPSRTSVLLPVPNKPGERATSAVVTLTSCHPLFSTAERYVVYGELDSEYPSAQGVPASLLAVVG